MEEDLRVDFVGLGRWSSVERLDLLVGVLRQVVCYHAHLLSSLGRLKMDADIERVV
jgi:hypothetical protein